MIMFYLNMVDNPVFFPLTWDWDWNWNLAGAGVNIYRVNSDPVELVQIAVILPEVEVQFPSLPQGCGSSIGCRVGLIIVSLVLVQQFYNSL